MPYILQGYIHIKIYLEIHWCSDYWGEGDAVDLVMPRIE